MHKKIPAYFILFIMVLAAVRAHSNVLYKVDLDFDPDMESGVVQAAQSYLGIEEMPVRFDYDRELIIVHFDRPLEYSVTVNPSDYSIAGFRDDSRVSKSGEVRYDPGERKAIAQEVFDALPPELQAELVYDGETGLYMKGVFKHSWYRYVDEVFVANEHLEVEVDGVTGEVVAWRLSVFWAPAERIRIRPAISYGVAQKIAEITFDATPVDFEPILVVNKDSPVWIVKIKKLYPVFIWVDALDGRVMASGSLRTEMAENYDYGREVPVEETDFIKGIYGN